MRSAGHRRPATSIRIIATATSSATPQMSAMTRLTVRSAPVIFITGAARVFSCGVMDATSRLLGDRNVERRADGFVPALRPVAACALCPVRQDLLFQDRNGLCLVFGRDLDQRH